jgi:hypothetical protein
VRADRERERRGHHPRAHARGYWLAPPSGARAGRAAGWSTRPIADPGLTPGATDLRPLRGLGPCGRTQSASGAGIILGLTPGATDLRPLRGLGRNRPRASSTGPIADPGLTPGATDLRPLRGLRTPRGGWGGTLVSPRACARGYSLSPLRGFPARRPRGASRSARRRRANARRAPALPPPAGARAGRAAGWSTRPIADPGLTPGATDLRPLRGVGPCGRTGSTSGAGIILGLTPGATDLRPLRGLGRNRPRASSTGPISHPGLTPGATDLRPLRGLRTPRGGWGGTMSPPAGASAR